MTFCALDRKQVMLIHKHVDDILRLADFGSLMTHSKRLFGGPNSPGQTIDRSSYTFNRLAEDRRRSSVDGMMRPRIGRSEMTCHAIREAQRSRRLTRPVPELSKTCPMPTISTGMIRWARQSTALFLVSPKSCSDSLWDLHSAAKQFGTDYRARYPCTAASTARMTNRRLSPRHMKAK